MDIPQHKDTQDSIRIFKWRSSSKFKSSTFPRIEIAEGAEEGEVVKWTDDDMIWNSLIPHQGDVVPCNTGKAHLSDH